MTDNYAGFFEKAMSTGGGGKTPGFEWEGKTTRTLGTSVTGVITDIYKGKVTDIDTGKPKLDKNGSEQPELSITIKTDLRNWAGAAKPGKDEDGNDLPASEDEGLRRLYFRYAGLRRVGAAVLAAGATLDDFFAGADNGAQIFVKRIANDGRMLDFEVAYKPGTPKADGFFGGASPAETQQTAAPTENPFGATAAPSDEPPF